MIIPVNTKGGNYDIVIEKGILTKISSFANLNRKVLIVTDDGVPKEYASIVSSQCAEAYIETIAQGEESKSISNFEHLLSVMLQNGFTRKDCVIAVGGGVVGDLSGFVASSFMRGVDFYNVPTTMLSQIDSSIGGKVAINIGKIKNVVGAFYQPKGVFIDGEVLKTLPQRQVSSGLAEAVKMALTSDENLFTLFEKDDFDIELITQKALLIKKDVVEKDEKEENLRKILNFGHTIGHGIESVSFGNLYHGECVALGMIPFCSAEILPRVKKVLEKLHLPTDTKCDKDKVMEAISHDKKAGSEGITVIAVSKIGSYEMKKMTMGEIEKISQRYFEVK